MPENPLPPDDQTETAPEAGTETEAGAVPAAPDDTHAAPAVADTGGAAQDESAIGSEAAGEPAASAAPIVEPTPHPSPEAAALPASAAPVVADLPPAACAARLAELFPAVFTPGAAKPLKLRIQADIQQRAPGIFTRKTLSIYLHRHTTSTAYLKALAKAPSRIDLNGTPAGEVADEHRQAAVAELERRRALHDARRAAERQAQRDAHRGAQRQAPVEGQAPPQGETVRQQPRQGRRDGPSGARRDAPAKGQALRGQARGAAHEAPHASPADGGRGRPVDERARRSRGAEPQARHPQAEDRPARRGSAAEATPPTEPINDDPVRRERAMLLRAYESTTLTRRNFCALKRITEAELDAQLAQARKEAEERSAARPPYKEHVQSPPPQRAEAQTRERGPRADRGVAAQGRPPSAAKP
jgi:ProP effector